MHNWLGGAYVPEHTWTDTNTHTLLRPHSSCPLSVRLCVTLFSLSRPCEILTFWFLFPTKFLLSLSLTVSLWLIVSLPLALSLPGYDSPLPNISLFFSHSVCPQVQYNSYLPRGVLNGRPLLKCLSITFECLLSLTSAQHTRWACTHSHTCTHKHYAGEIKWYFLWRSGIFSLYLFNILVILWEPQ